MAQLNLTFIPDTAGDNDIPFLPPWALLLLGTALFGLRGKLERKTAKLMALGTLLLGPVAIEHSDSAYANPAPQSVTTVSNWYYLHGDHLDTPQVVTDANQAVVWEAQYTPFGKATVTNHQIENNLRFPGQYYDEESGLHYNLMRYYEPESGRYVQSDPIGLMGGLNTYAYALGNPVLLFDPLGLAVICNCRCVGPAPYRPDGSGRKSCMYKCDCIDTDGTRPINPFTPIPGDSFASPTGTQCIGQKDPPFITLEDGTVLMDPWKNPTFNNFGITDHPHFKDRYPELYDNLFK